MKRYLILTALLPFAVLAQPLNTMNNPNQPGYEIPSQQRMQTQMLGQQQQQKGMLNQQLKTQTQLQQQSLQNQMNNNTQMIQQGQPRVQPLPNTNGGMLSGGTSDGQQQHMLPPRSNGDMLNNPQN
ncbi:MULTISPECIES: DUF2756 family protein [Lelliottia]|jgi:hypothetical protein|uniref:DUF2756 family protein n=1 Tax=Lelliottia wanjuensis TaxID=3050585 RepID=A0AAP4D6B1_9ENTR|nr:MULTISPECIES: DUF2756 family protein [unclassified Lelliottia]MDK9362473.1 DUF2756 family protein [Lelliottia sp. V106_12]MDK9583546.1 DUF2756 family protein [Lelliottia sp. V86_10]MDK9617751.1 DUF2756 family protein [Lelliottia sp. V106_9]